MTEYKYKAFLSYRHQTEHALASALESGLQKFAKPFNLRRGLQIYRDERNQNPTDDLFRDVKAAMDDSEFFILMASPGSVESNWVPREVQHWLENRSLKHFLIARCDGSIEWDSERNDDFDWQATDCLPEVLRGQFKSMPLYTDLKELKNEENLTLKNEPFRQKVAEISAYLRGISIEDLYGEEVRQHRRYRRRVAIGVALLSAFLVFAVAMWIKANREETAAKDNLAQTQWGNGVYFRDRNEMVRASHWFAKAADSPDRDFANAARLAATQAIRGGRLENIFMHNQAGVKAGHCEPSAGDLDPCVLKSVFGVAINDDETQLVSWGEDGVLDYFDASDGRELIEARCEGEEAVLCHDKPVYGAIIIGDGSRVLSWDSWDSVKIWWLGDFRHGQPDTHEESLRFSPVVPSGSEPGLIGAAAAIVEHGIRFLNWSKDKAWLWEPDSEKLISELIPECNDPERPDLIGADFNRKQSLILMWGRCRSGGSSTGALWIWDIETLEKADGKDNQLPSNYYEPGEYPVGLTADEHGTRILTWSEENAQLWDVTSEDCEPVLSIGNALPEGFPAIKGARLNDDGTLLLTWSDDGTNSIRMWDLDKRREAIPPLYYDNVVQGAKFISGDSGDCGDCGDSGDSGDSRVLAWGDMGTIRSWAIRRQPSLLQATSDELIHLKEDPSSSCSGIRLDQVSPEGCRRYADRDLLLTWQTENRDGETDYTVRLWQLSSQTQLGDPLAHMDQVTGARLDSAGERVLTWGKDDTVRLWHHSTGKGLIPSMSHKNDVVGARFNADESRILSWGKDGTVRLWKASNGEPVIRSLVIPEGSPVKSAEFRAGEDCVVAQADNGKLWAWDLSFHSRGGADDTREMVEASTGTRLDAEGELKVMPRGEWLRTCKRLDLLHSAVCKLPVTH